MELGGDILCAQKLEQPTIPQGHCLPISCRHFPHTLLDADVLMYHDLANIFHGSWSPPSCLGQQYNRLRAGSWGGGSSIFEVKTWPSPRDFTLSDGSSTDFHPNKLHTHRFLDCHMWRNVIDCHGMSILRPFHPTNATHFLCSARYLKQLVRSPMKRYVGACCFEASISTFVIHAIYRQRRSFSHRKDQVDRMEPLSFSANGRWLAKILIKKHTIHIWNCCIW